MEFLAGIGLVWLAIWGALFIAALVCAEYETPGIFTLVLGVAFCWLIWQLRWEPLQWIAAHKAALTAIAGAYLVAGVVWDRFCAREAERQKLSGGPRLIPEAGKHKRKFTTWIFLWWASMINFILSDIVVEFRDWVLRQFGGIYTAIAQRHFR